MKFLMLALVIGTGFLSGFGQHSEEPNITSSIGFEKERNSEIEKALFEAYDLNETDDKTTRYYYNYVDLNGDGINEVLVYIFSAGNSVEPADVTRCYLEKLMGNTMSSITLSPSEIQFLSVRKRRTDGRTSYSSLAVGASILAIIRSRNLTAEDITIIRRY